MELADVTSKILLILQELHEDIDFEKEDKLVDDKILDSFDLVSLVTEMGDEFDVDITAKDFIPDNFNSVTRLAQMVVRLMDE